MNEPKQEQQEPEDNGIVLDVARTAFHNISGNIVGIEGQLMNIMADRVSPVEAKKSLESVLQRVLLLKNNIRQSDIILRILSDTNKRSYKKHNIRLLLQEMAGEFRKDAFAKELSIQIATDGGNDGEEFVTDYSMLYRALEQVLRNAIQFSWPPGERYSPEAKQSEVLIRYSVTTYALSVEITNWGYGIEEREAESIFSFGYVGRNSRKAGSFGTGSGLFLARKCIEKLNGTIELKAQGEETTFLIQLTNLSNEKNSGS